MDDIQLKILDKLDAISEDMSEMKVTLAKQEISLQEHIRRTNLLEEKIKPIEEHVSAVNTTIKIFGKITGITSIVASIVMAWTKLFAKH